MNVEKKHCKFYKTISYELINSLEVFVQDLKLKRKEFYSKNEFKVFRLVYLYTKKHIGCV
jgi:hypothetical protein